MDNIQARDLVTAAIGDRRLIWLGAAGQDAEALSQIPQFTNCYSVHSSLRAGGVEAMSVESLTGLRQPEYDVMAFLGTKGRPLVDSLAIACNAPSLLITRAPYEFIPFLLASRPQVQHLGTSYTAFRALSEKSVVEAELKDEPGITTIPWRSLPDDSSRPGTLRAELRLGPIVVRSSRQDGGSGHELIHDAAQLDSSKNAKLPEPISVAPYLSGHVPICASACVFLDGGITLHTPSVQLVGIPACCENVLGYCGNDFGAIKQISPGALAKLDTCVRTAGAWLHSKGFIGAYGVDALVRDDEVVFVEINPRFLGSSRTSAALDAELGQPDIFLDHLMAWLGAPSYASAPLAEQAGAQSPWAQVLCFNNDPEFVRLSEDGIQLPKGFSAELAPDSNIDVGSASLLFVLKAQCSVTTDGKSIDESATDALVAAIGAFRPQRRDI